MPLTEGRGEHKLWTSRRCKPQRTSVAQVSPMFNSLHICEIGDDTVSAHQRKVHPSCESWDLAKAGGSVLPEN